MALETGTIVDRYILEGVLGEGGMAVVYRARHRELGSLHAIKQLKVEDPTIQNRLIQEGRLQSGLRHPNVVSVTDMITIEGSPALVMEYVDGPNLSQLLARRRPSMHQCDTIARGILKGVAAAHGHGMVHRDLKPANILMASADGDMIPKISDFGLAKLLATLSDNDGLTQEGAVMGTPSYMAPEQLNDSRDVDARADVFSLGAILYELVCGRRCFEGDTNVKIWLAISKGEFIAPKALSPALPTRMERAIQGALVVDRDNRISGVGELMDVWSTDDNATHVPMTVRTTGSDLGNKTAATDDPEAITRDNAHTDLAFEHTQDSNDAAGLAQGAVMTPIDLAEAPTAEGKRRPTVWLLGIAAFCGAALLVLTWGNNKAKQPSQATVAIADGSTITTAGSGSAETVHDARKALFEGDPPAADRILNRLLARASATAEIHIYQAFTAFFRDRPELHIEGVDVAYRISRENQGAIGRTIKLLHRALYAGGQTPESLRQWGELRQDHADDPIVELAFLIATRSQRKPDTVLTDIENAQKRFSDSPAFSILKLKWLSETGRHRQGLKAAQLAELRFPATNSIRLEVAQAELHLGMVTSAATKLKQLLIADAGLIEARIGLAEVYARNGNEADRQTQLIMSQSDVTPATAQLSFLNNHGRALAADGRMREAHKIWRFCIDHGKAKQRPVESLACARSALKAHIWLAPFKTWAPWVSRIESILSDPAIETGVRQGMALLLTWTQARQALETGDINKARTGLSRLLATEQRPTALPGVEHYGPFLKLEIGLRTQTPLETQAALKALEAADGFPQDTPTCALRLWRAQAAQTEGDFALAIAELSALLEANCRPMPGHPYTVATAHLRLASIYIGRGENDVAIAGLKQFKKYWPRADADLPLAIEAKRLGRLISQ